MEDFDRLDLNEINTRLVEIFNKNKKGNEDFSGNVINRPFIGPSIVIVNKITELDCYVMFEPDLIEGKYVIQGGIISSCSNIPKSGTQTLKNIIEFGKKYGYDIFKLTNLSKINFTCDGVDLKLDLTSLKLLTIGNSWYSQFGFNNPITIENERIIYPLIQLTFEEFGRLQTLNKNVYFEIVRETIEYFTGTCFEFSLNDKIHKYFKQVEVCLNELFPMRICLNINSDELFIKQDMFIRQMIFFIFFKVKYEEGKYNQLVGEKLNEYITIELHFDTVGGFKKRKTRKSKRKSKRKSNLINHKRIKVY